MTGSNSSLDIDISRTVNIDLAWEKFCFLSFQSKNCFKILISLKDVFEAIYSSETSGCLGTIRRYNPDGRTLIVQRFSAADAFRFRHEMALLFFPTNSNCVLVHFIDERGLRITYLRPHPMKLKLIQILNENDK
jgi:hypothetical protein